jgi:CelD/BcsL family acetyltransferase involved in cellulose biosynthesis
MLRDGDRPICAAFGLIVNKTFYGLKMGYDQEFRDLSPGHLLQEYLIKTYQASATVDCLNFVASAGWQRMWKPQQYETFELTVFRKTIRGRILCISQKSHNALRSLRRILTEKCLVRERGRYRLRAGSKFTKNRSASLPKK